MKASPTLMATLVGTIVGTGGWLTGLGRVLWPEHPMWALFFATLAATIATHIIVAQQARHRAMRPTERPH